LSNADGSNPTSCTTKNQTKPISSINLVQQILRDRYKFQFNSNPAQNSTQHNPHATQSPRCQAGRKTEHLENLLSSAAERGAHNPEVGGSKPPGGILTFASVTEAGCHSASDIKLEQHITGMAQARRFTLWAHNPEDTGSKPVAGIYHTSHRCIKALEQHFTGMAQARRFTLWAHNSEDTGSKPVVGIHHTSHRCIKALEHLITLPLHEEGFGERSSLIVALM
jgi:hypothetical protein